MAKCPKCGGRLSPLDWQQECPHCKTNLMFYGFEKRFYEDAKYAEMGLAKVRVKFEYFKCAFIGGKLASIRFASALLPVLALLLPVGVCTFSLPMFEQSLSLSIIGVIKALTDGGFSLLGTLSGSPVIGESASLLRAAFISYLIPVLFAVLILALQFLCFISIKKTAALISASSVLGGLSVLYVLSCVNVLTAGTASGLSCVSSSGGFGAYVLLLAFAVVAALNITVALKGIPVHYKEGDLYRVDTAKRLKRGEITLDDISQPIYETEEEKLERERAIDDTVHSLETVSEEVKA